MRAQMQVCFNLEQDMNNWWIALLRHVSRSLTDFQIKLMQITLSVAEIWFSSNHELLWGYRIKTDLPYNVITCPSTQFTNLWGVDVGLHHL